MTEHWDVAVIGCGGMGSAALYHLAQRGVRVCAIERFKPGHDRGSSHGETRIIRKAYLEHPNYVPLLDRAYVLWDRLAEECEQELIVRSGLLAMGHVDSMVIRGQAACYAVCDLPHEVLDEDEIRYRYPALGVGRDWRAYHDPLGGFLRVESCVAQHAQRAEIYGATIYSDEVMQDWRADGDGVFIETNRRTLKAGRMVLAAGPWSVAQLRALGIETRVLRKVLLWYGGEGVQRYALGDLPCFLVGRDASEDIFYGFPALDGKGVKVAEHNISMQDGVDDPLQLDRALAPADEALVLPFIEDFLPHLQPRRTHHAVCMYTMTSDEHFVVDVHPLYPQVVIAGGFSGHGFKFASVMGEVLAELALDGRSQQPIEFLRLKRFAGGTE